MNFNYYVYFDNTQKKKPNQDCISHFKKFSRKIYLYGEKNSMISSVLVSLYIYMEVSKLKRPGTNYFKKHRNYITHKSPSLMSRPKLTIRQTQNLDTISLASPKPKLSNKSFSPIPSKIHTKLPSIDKKKVDISQKSLKNVPARHFIFQYKENIRPHRMESPSFDLRLLREINSKLDKETFEEDQKILNFGLSCRHELGEENMMKGIKRVRFQLV